MVNSAGAESASEGISGGVPFSLEGASGGAEPSSGLVISV